MPAHHLIGSMLTDRRPRPCGLCGDTRKLSRAHVPPQAAGNSTKVQRAPSLIDDSGTRRPGRWADGGLWVRGLCDDCNNRAGSRYDLAYADFASQVRRLSTPIARSLPVLRGEAPAARFAPGLVVRSVLYGMFAINLRLRHLFPELARDLLDEKHPGEGRVAWPEKVTLRLGLTMPSLSHAAVVSSGIWSTRVLTQQAVHFSFADIAFPPLVWSLVTVTADLPTQLGPQITDGLADASDWVQYGPDRTHVDLRSLTRQLPTITLPLLTRQDDWIELLTRDGGDADAVVIFGAIP